MGSLLYIRKFYAENGDIMKYIAADQKENAFTTDEGEIAFIVSSHPKTKTQVNNPIFSSGF